MCVKALLFQKRSFNVFRISAFFSISLHGYFNKELFARQPKPSQVSRNLYAAFGTVQVVLRLTYSTSVPFSLKLNVRNSERFMPIMCKLTAQFLFVLLKTYQ